MWDADDDSYSQRVMDVLKHTGGRGAFDVKMPGLPSYRSVARVYGNKTKRMANNIKMPDTGKVMNLAVLGGIGVLAYVAYVKIIAPLLGNAGADAAEQAQDKANKAFILTQKKDSLTQTATSVAKTADVSSLKNLSSTAKTDSIANWLYTCLDVFISADNQDGIVKQVNAMSDQTLLLVYRSFGIREFPLNFFSSFEGNLRHETESSIVSAHFKADLVNALKAKMSSDNYTKISAKIDRVLSQIITG